MSETLYSGFAAGGQVCSESFVLEIDVLFTHIVVSTIKKEMVVAFYVFRMCVCSSPKANDKKGMF